MVRRSLILEFILESFNAMIPPMEEVIQRLNLRPLWTTDYLIPWYTSPHQFPKRHNLDYLEYRMNFECAYYLMPAGCICPFEKLRTENIFVHSVGAPCAIYTIQQDGSVLTQILGKDIEEDEIPAFVLPSGTYRAAEPLWLEGYTLLTEINVPEFKLGDNEKGYWEKLRQEFPALSEEVRRLAWPEGVDLRSDSYVYCGEKKSDAE